MRKKRDMKKVVTKAIKALNKMGFVFQYVKALNSNSYEIALSHVTDGKKLKEHFDAMWLPIRYKQNEDVFFTVMLKTA